MDNIIIWEEVGERIENLRHKRKLTQAQFGKLLGVSAQYVGRIERGQKLSVDLIAVICKETDVTTDYIIFGTVDPLDDIALLCELSPAQLATGIDILKRLAELIIGKDGNAALIKEIMRQQSQKM